MKKILALLAALSLLAGCGSKTEQSAFSAGSLSAMESMSTVDSATASPSDDADNSDIDSDILATFRVKEAEIEFLGPADSLYSACAVYGDFLSGEFVERTEVIINRDGADLTGAYLQRIRTETDEYVERAKAGDSIVLELDTRLINSDVLKEGDLIILYKETRVVTEMIYTINEMQEFFAQLEQYARTGDIRLLEHLNFSDQRNYDGFKAVLEDETARELWCAAYAPTVWSLPKLERDLDFSKISYLTFSVKVPRWMYISYLHAGLSDCAPMSAEPAAVKSYFETYAEQIPYLYKNCNLTLIDGTLKLNGERFTDTYVSNTGGDDIFSKAIANPLWPFTELVEDTQYTTELPEMTEDEKLFTEYYRLVADNKFFEAIELVEGTSLAMKDTTVLNQLADLTNEQKTKLQAELDKLPKGEFYQYSHIGAKDKLFIRGILISYGLEYNKDFEGFGEGNPIPVKEVTFCYPSSLSDKPSVEHFPAIYNIMMNMEG